MSSVYIVDVETTSLDENIGSLIQVGVTELDKETGIVKPVYEAFVKDGVAIDPNAWIFQNTPLTPAKIEEKWLPIAVVKEALNELFKNTPVTAYKKEFDFKWLRSRGIEIPLEDPCIMERAKRKMQSRKFAVPVALAYFQIEAVEPHGALDDSILEAVILRCLENNFPETQNQLTWNVNYDITRFQPKPAPKAEPIPGISDAEAKKERYKGKIHFFERIISALDAIEVELTFNLKNHPSEAIRKIHTDAITESKAHLLKIINEKYEFCKNAVK